MWRDLSHARGILAVKSVWVCYMPNNILVMLAHIEVFLHVMSLTWENVPGLLLLNAMEAGQGPGDKARWYSRTSNRHKLVLYIKLGQFVNYSSKHKAILRVMTLHLIDLLATINKHMYVCAFCLCTCVHTHGSMCARGWLCADCVCACDCEHASANTSQMLFPLVCTKYMAEEPK